MFREWNHIVFPQTAAGILTPLLMAFACGYFVNWLYRTTHKSPGYSQNFAYSLVLLAMITAVVIAVIGSNLARAFGLVGALSIIRFRTAIKEPMDIMYVFFSLAVGMAAGVGYYKMAVIGTTFIGFVLCVFSHSGANLTFRREYLLQFSYIPEEAEVEPLYRPILEKFSRRFEVVNIKAIKETGTTEYSFYIQIHDREDGNKLVQALQENRGIDHINLYFEEENY
jgi:uncharacterized membrane protein YhiD involved in acid resistance